MAKVTPSHKSAKQKFFIIDQVSPGEFPWSCMLLTDENKFIGPCTVVPEDYDNEVSSGTYRVITTAHKLISLKENE